jgi:hypothetical protein
MRGEQSDPWNPIVSKVGDGGQFPVHLIYRWIWFVVGSYPKIDPLGIYVISYFPAFPHIKQE